jgi:magnesium chelatase family protein
LPDNAVKESEQRVEASLKYSGYRMPRQKVVVNLAPADGTLSGNENYLIHMLGRLVG